MLNHIYIRLLYTPAVGHFCTIAYIGSIIFTNKKKKVLSNVIKSLTMGFPF